MKNLIDAETQIAFTELEILGEEECERLDINFDTLEDIDSAEYFRQMTENNNN